MTNYSGQPRPVPPQQPAQVAKKKPSLFGIKNVNAIVVLWLCLGVFGGFAGTNLAGNLFLKNRCDVLAETISLPTKNADNTCLVFYNKKWVEENKFMGALFQR